MITTRMEKDMYKFEDAMIIFRNFSGEKTEFNRSGARNFSIIIDNPDVAEDMIREGWNLKPLKPRDEGDEPKYHLPITLSFDNVPPKVYMVVNHRKVALTADTVSTLDYSDIIGVDLVVRPYDWEVNGKTGRKAYLKTMYVTIQEDEFGDKYDYE